MPVSNLPLAARRQIAAQNAEAERMLAELNAPPGATPPAATAPPATVVPFDPNAPAPEPVQPPPTAVEPPAQPDALQVLSHKFDVLQGKYNAETSRLMGAAQALRDENARLLEQLQSRPAAPAPNAPPAPPAAGVVTEKERIEYGEELIALMDRIAKANSSAEITRLTNELNALKQSVRVTVSSQLQGQQERVWTALNTAVPNWQSLNVSQPFLDWLEVRDMISGVQRKVGLTQAFEAGDAQRVVGIFRQYIEEDSRSRPTAPTPVVDAATLAAPGQPRGGSGEAPTPQSERVWSESEINEFYSRVQRGRISAEEKASTEKAINAAIKAGRVRPDRDDRHLPNRN